MKVTVDSARCQGHAVCARLAPQIFVLDSDGYNRMGSFTVDPSHVDVVRRAVALCPERAIRIDDPNSSPKVV